MASQKPSFEERTPDGDNRPRSVCTSCGFVDYQNPRIVVGVVATWEGRVLLCRRAIDPREGYWTIPAGFMEQHETTREGALRETEEESGARVELDDLLAVYDIPHISQVQMIYRGRMVSEHVEAGIESLEVGLFKWDEIPWEDLAFPSVEWALKNYREAHGEEAIVPFTTPASFRPGDRIQGL